MREHLYGILAAVVLCMWKVEKTDAQYLLDVVPNLHAFKLFYLYLDADFNYNLLQSPTERMEFLKPQAQQTFRFLRDFISEDHVLRMYANLDYDNKNDYNKFLKTDAIVSKHIILNAYHTLEAYLTAVNYRVCAFFYKYVNIDEQKSDECLKLSSYMQFYAFLEFEKKVTDFRILWWFFETEKEWPNPLQAKNIYKIFEKLSMNFLEFPSDERTIPSLRHDVDNVYNPDILSAYDSKGKKYFISIFEHYLYFEKAENRGQDNYDETEYGKIRNLITNVYTRNFATLLNYFLQVTIGIPYPSNLNPPIPEFESAKIMWNYTPMLLQIMNLPTEYPRGIVSFSNDGNMVLNTGNIIYRSNALEILRQISYYDVLRRFPNSSGRVSQIIQNINSLPDFQCQLFYRLPTSIVDYWIQIPIQEEVVEFLLQNPN